MEIMVLEGRYRHFGKYFSISFYLNIIMLSRPYLYWYQFLIIKEYSNVNFFFNYYI